MEDECPSELLDETAPMAGKSWQPSHESPPRREGQGTLNDITNNGNKGWWGKRNNPETMLKCRMVLQQI